MTKLVTLIAKVTKNSMLATRVAVCSFFLFTVRFAKPKYGEESSLVNSSAITPTANRILVSVKANGGSCVLIPLI